ncbi:MAG TPA: flavin reductase family protein [Bryobacteraceae bacterium]|nr:flavin reductase family protein [Bryobacteraceae bacterium]
MSRAISRAPLDSFAFRRACGLFATGVAVLSTRASDGAPHGLTVNSFSSLSLSPPLIMVAIDRDCTSLHHFEISGSFAVNILRVEQLDLSIRFAQLPEGRFTGIPWREGVTGSPILEGVLGVIECTTINVIDAGDHRALIGESVAVEIGEGRPLVFFNGGYTRLDQ